MVIEEYQAMQATITANQNGWDVILVAWSSLAIGLVSMSWTLLGRVNVIGCDVMGHRMLGL